MKKIERKYPIGLFLSDVWQGLVFAVAPTLALALAFAVGMLGVMWLMSHTGVVFWSIVGGLVSFVLALIGLAHVGREVRKERAIKKKQKTNSWAA